MTLKDIAVQMEKVIAKETGANVEINFRNDNVFSLYGEPEALDKAMGIMNQVTTATYTKTDVYDADEDGPAVKVAFFTF